MDAGEDEARGLSHKRGELGDDSCGEAQAMKRYLWGYVWTHWGRVITPEREHISRTDNRTVAAGEVMMQRRLLGLPKESVVCVLWRKTKGEG